MFFVQDTILSDDIATAKFACNLSKCKGACCVVGDAGAPVSAEEIPQLKKAYALLEDEPHPEARKKVEQDGLIEESSDGRNHISCRDEGECVFVSYSEDGIARCAIQQAFLAMRIDWEKPLSCHLSPLRLKRRGEFDYANFDYVEQMCSPACTKGREEKIFLSDFLEKPLIRRYGEQWYREFSTACEEIRTQKNEAVSL